MPLGNQTFRNTRVEMIEDKEVCPYNKSHLILPARMQRHLIHCRKDVLSKPTHPFHHEAKQMVTCPFDANHHIYKTELSRHVENCNSRLEVAKDRIKDEGPAPAWRSAIPQGRIIQSTEEDWGDEADRNPHEAYIPENKVLESDTPLLYNIQGKSKSEKRDFRASQRHKYAANQGASGWQEDEEFPVGLNEKLKIRYKKKSNSGLENNGVLENNGAWENNGWGDQASGTVVDKVSQQQDNDGWNDVWDKKQTCSKPATGTRSPTKSPDSHGSRCSSGPWSPTRTSSTSPDQDTAGSSSPKDDRRISRKENAGRGRGWKSTTPDVGRNIASSSYDVTETPILQKISVANSSSRADANYDTELNHQFSEEIPVPELRLTVSSSSPDIFQSDDELSPEMTPDFSVNNPSSQENFVPQVNNRSQKTSPRGWNLVESDLLPIEGPHSVGRGAKLSSVTKPPPGFNGPGAQGSPRLQHQGLVDQQYQELVGLQHPVGYSGHMVMPGHFPVGSQPMLFQQPMLPPGVAPQASWGPSWIGQERNVLGVDGLGQLLGKELNLTGAESIEQFSEEESNLLGAQGDSAPWDLQKNNSTWPTHQLRGNNLTCPPQDKHEKENVDKPVAKPEKTPDWWLGTNVENIKEFSPPEKPVAKTEKIDWWDGTNVQDIKEFSPPGKPVAKVTNHDWWEGTNVEDIKEFTPSVKSNPWNEKSIDAIQEFRPSETWGGQDKPLDTIPFDAEDFPSLGALGSKKNRK